jgi:hypothetical protein
MKAPMIAFAAAVILGLTSTALATDPFGLGVSENRLNAHIQRNRCEART